MDFLCRTCLSNENTDMFPLFDDKFQTNLAEKVVLCTNLELFPVEGLPNDICSKCFNILSIADNFRIKCRNSDIFLRESYPKLFSNENKANIKDLEAVNCEKDVSVKRITLKESDKINNSDDLELKKNIKSSEQLFFKDAIVEIKKERIDFMDSSNGFDNNYDDDAFLINIKSNKKSRKRIKLKDSNQESLNIENSLNALIKEEMDFSLDEKEKFNNMESLETSATIEEMKKRKIYICNECGKPLSKRSSLKRHIENIHSEHKKIKSLTSSRKTGHGKDKRFHCVLCPYVTKFSQSLVYHERIHTGERPHKCPHCSRSFSQPGSLSCHLKTHSDKTYFTCASCGKQFKHKDSYEVHKLVHSENRELFTCEICNTSLKSRKTLESHMNRHNNIKNFSCETCGLRFVTLVELINHSKKHNTDKVYKCNFCDFKTALKRSLQSHTKRHSNYRPFKCQSCDLSCFTKWELRNHEKTHTRETNYSCFVCQRKFIHSSSVNKHMQRTHGVKYQRTEDVDRRKVK